MKWTRQQAIDYGIKAAEVERYVVNPGQACAYKIEASYEDPRVAREGPGRARREIPDQGIPQPRPADGQRAARRAGAGGRRLDREQAVSEPAPDLDAYFARIGYAGPRAPTLATLHAIAAHHSAAISFENLDVLLNRPPKLDPARRSSSSSVHARRGGYCFQHRNGLLLHILGVLGYAVKPLSARVRLQRPRDFIPPRTHLFVRVELDGEPWVVDSGVGSFSLTAAIRLEEDTEQATPHEPRRFVREGGSLFHQVKVNGEWTDVCEFTGEEMPLIDRELGNWWTSTNPESNFRQRLTAARAEAWMKHRLHRRHSQPRVHPPAWRRDPGKARDGHARGIARSARRTLRPALPRRHPLRPAGFAVAGLKWRQWPGAALPSRSVQPSKTSAEASSRR